MKTFFWIFRINIIKLLQIIPTFNIYYWKTVLSYLDFPKVFTEVCQIFLRGEKMACNNYLVKTGANSSSKEQIIMATFQKYLMQQRGW